MVHISAKGTRKVDQGREISRGYAFLQTISAYSWSSNFPESIACQNQFKSSLKHSCVDHWVSGPSFPYGVKPIQPIPKTRQRGKRACLNPCHCLPVLLTWHTNIPWAYICPPLPNTSFS